MTVIGLDLSLTSSGIAFIYDNGTATTTSVQSKGKATDTLEDRGQRLARIVASIWRHVEYSEAQLIVIESPSFGSAGSGTWDRSGLWWMVVDEIAAGGFNYPAMVAPTTLKKWLTGSGRAEKNTVGVHVGRLFPDTEIKTDDAADALGLAHLGACRLGYPVTRLPGVHNDKVLAATKVQWPRGMETP